MMNPVATRYWSLGYPRSASLLLRLGISSRRARVADGGSSLYSESPQPIRHSRLRFAVHTGGFTGYNKC